MASTMVEQLAVTTGQHAGKAIAGPYHVHSWRPWMSLYGLRLKPRGTAQPEVLVLDEVLHSLRSPILQIMSVSS